MGRTSNLFRYKSQKAWANADLDDQEQEMKRQMELLTAQTSGHDWDIRLDFDENKNEIVIMIGDAQTDNEWRKVITSDDMENGMELRHLRAYYLHLGSLIKDGNVKYEYPPNGVGPLNVILSKDEETMQFTADPI